MNALGIVLAGILLTVWFLGAIDPGWVGGRTGQVVAAYHQAVNGQRPIQGPVKGETVQ